jgi:tRNA threonylcarbamoyladenosine biosynthesis protein TsaB
VRILAFDTATAATAVALSLGDAAVLEARDDPAPGERPGHASRLLPLVHELLDRAGIGFADLDRIAVGVGPGTFTGLRIGVATARALAQASGRELVGVPTLRALASQAASEAHAHGFQAVAGVLDARRGEVFVQAWRVTEVDDPVAEPWLPATVLAPAELPAVLRRVAGGVLAVGDGAVEFRRFLERSGARVPEDAAQLHRVTAAAHLRLAEHLPARAPAEIQPVYLRPPDAKEPSSRRLAGPR